MNKPVGKDTKGKKSVRDIGKNKKTELADSVWLFNKKEEGENRKQQNDYHGQKGRKNE